VPISGRVERKASNAARSISQMKTLAPAVENVSANALPMPDAPAVTNTRIP